MKIRNIVLLLIASLIATTQIYAQSSLNNRADNIVGEYEGVQEGYKFRAKIVKLTNDTYRGQVTWMERSRDEKGNVLLDTKNPDHKLRTTPADRIVLFSGLTYNSKRQEWSGCKIYDPLRGIRAKMTATFTDDGRLKIKGSLLGISESVYWTKLKK